MLYIWNLHNIVNQLYFKKKKSVSKVRRADFGRPQGGIATPSRGMDGDSEWLTMNGWEIQVRQGSVMPIQQGRLQVAFVTSTAIYGTQGEFRELAELARCSTPKPGSRKLFSTIPPASKNCFLQRSSREGWKTFGNSHPPTWLYFKVELEKRGILYDQKTQISLSA